MSRLLLAIALLHSLGAFSAPRIVVVKSAELSAYGALVAGFSAEVRGEVSEILLGGSEDPAKLFRKISADRPALVLALGPAAASGAKRLLAEVPVVFAMVPYYEKYGLEGPKITGISLTSDLSLQLEALGAAFPEAKRVGVLADPRHSAAVIAEARRAASPLELNILPLNVEDTAKVDRVLSAAVGKIDALLMIADKTVGNAQVVRQLISFCKHERLPLVAISSTQVKEGATFSLSASPSSIGQQAGRLARRIVVEKVDPGALPVAAPEVLELSVSLASLRSAAAPERSALELLRLAARRGFAIKVFE